ncbi:MAG: hypothetical protein E7478_06145, partial [Ruminococcaceae bacterium]|nr:hypothetical protein [Oscillospiraceae bacterium]
MAVSLCYMSLFALGICALTAIVSYKEKRILAAAAAGVFGFFAEYIIIGGMLFLFDVFSVTASLLIIVGVDAAGLSVLWIKKRKAPFRGMRLSVSRLGLFFIFAALILSFGKFGYYGMAQDQGVYQVRAIDIMYSSPQCLKTFGEYDTLSPQQQEEYRSYVYGILGYDEYVSTLPTLSEEEKPNGVSGFFHGIPTYPAILALWGNMFGMQNMLGVNSLFFLGLIITALYLCEELKLDTVSTAIAMSLLTFSPIVIWVAKSSLTELFLAYIVIMFMYLALHNDRLYIMLSAVPLVTFAFFHITVYTSLPLYMLIYIALYLRTDKKEYIAAALIYSAGFIVGFTMMIFTSPPYVAKNTINPFTRVFGELVEKCGGERTLLLLIYMMAVFFATFAVMCLCCKAVREKLKKLFSGSRLCAAYRVFGAAMLALCIYNLKD